MKFDSELMAAARESWHQYFLKDGGKDRCDSYADDHYEAYLAGFAAGQASERAALAKVGVVSGDDARRLEEHMRQNEEAARIRRESRRSP